MKYRPFGKTGFDVSEVGLGTWQLGSTEWGEVSEHDALAILERSTDAGVNFLETVASLHELPLDTVEPAAVNSLTPEASPPPDSRE